MDALVDDDDNTCLDEILVRKQIDGATQDMADTTEDGTTAGEGPVGTSVASADSSAVGIESEVVGAETSAVGAMTFAESTEFVATSAKVRTPYQVEHYHRQPPLSR